MTLGEGGPAGEGMQVGDGGAADQMQPGDGPIPADSQSPADVGAPDMPPVECVGPADCNDGLFCTADVCNAGVCQHSLGSGCLVNGLCHVEGQIVDQCWECIAASSTSSLTFIDGRPCTSATGIGKMCAAAACRGWQETSYLPKISGRAIASTTLRAAAPIASASGVVWAAGSFVDKSGKGGGVLLPLSAAGSDVVVDVPLHDIHHRAAVGDGGAVMFHDGGAWNKASDIVPAVDGERLSVFGVGVGVADVFLFGGSYGGQSAAVVRCGNLLGYFGCDDVSTGIDKGASIGGLFVDGSIGSGMGAAWAVDFGASADIYHRAALAQGWSRAAPLGCEDLGNFTSNTPCSATPGAVQSVYGTSSSNLWVVGDSGLLLRHDGGAWQRITAVSQLGLYDLTAVYASASEPLVTIFAQRDFPTGRAITLFNYNRKLNRWYGPIQAAFVSSSGGGSARVFDIAGPGYADLWAVGQSPQSGGIGARIDGWVLHLQ